MRRNVVGSFLVSSILGVVLIWIYLRQGLPLVPPAESFARMQPGLVAAAGGLLVFTYVLRGWRWRWLVRPVAAVPTRDLLLINWAGFLAIFALPLRLGEFARPSLLRLHHRLPITSSLGMCAAERAIDGVGLSIAAVFAFYFARRGDLREGDDVELTHLAGILALFAVVLVGITLVARYRVPLVGLVETALTRVSARFAERVADRLRSATRGLEALAIPRLVLAFGLETGVYLAASAVSIWLVGLGCGLPMTLTHAVVVMSIMSFGTAIPGGPGLFGSFQFATFIALNLFFPKDILQQEGAAFIFTLYVLQAGILVVLGGIGLIVLRPRARDLVGGAPEASDIGIPSAGQAPPQANEGTVRP